MKKFYDTCALLNLQDKAFDEPFFIAMQTLYELEDIKTSRNKDVSVKQAARRVARLMDEQHEMYTVLFRNVSDAPQFPHPSVGLDADICYNAYVCNNEIEPIVFVTDDILCRRIAQDIYKLPVSSSQVSEEIYTGYHRVTGSAQEINDFIASASPETMFRNQYLVCSNTETGEDFEMRFDGEKLVSLRIPPSHYLKAKNALQRCALDLLMNSDIDIVAILGTYGSGKSFLTTKMALYHVLEKGHQARVLGIREPAGEGAPVGYLKGTLEDKTRNFFLPIEQQLSGGEFELEALRQRGVLDTNIPYYMKGTTYSDTIMLVDEAEDLTEAQLRLVGTRLGSNSRIFLSGDYGQSLIDQTAGNPLVKLCNVLKGNPSFGCIYLDDDVRSSASKIFATLFKH